MNEVIFLVEEAPEGGYTPVRSERRSEADSLPDLRAQVRDAVRCHFEDGKAPKVIRLQFVREEVISA